MIDVGCPSYIEYREIFNSSYNSSEEDIIQFLP